MVLPGKTLALVGGDVTLAGGNLIAESGRIEVGSVAGSGLVSLTPTDSGWTLGYLGVANFGDIDLYRRASVDTSSDRSASPESVGSGNIQVQGRRVTLTDGSAIFALNLGAKPGGTLVVNASDTVEVNGTSADGSFLSAVFTDTEGAGAAGDLTINTRQLLIHQGAFVTSDTVNTGNAGKLTVNASDAVQMIGYSADGQSPSNLSSSTYGAGAGGEVTINTAVLQVLDAAIVQAFTRGAGDGGSLSVIASDSVELSGNTTRPDGRLAVSALVAATGSAGTGGEVTINTAALLLQDGAQISTSTIFGSGKAGTLSVTASDEVKLIGKSPDGQFPSGLRSSVERGATGDGGNLTLETGRLIVQDGAKISTSSEASGVAGNLQVEAGSIRLDNGAIAATTDSGNGGNISVQANDLLLLRNDSKISASAGTAQAPGNGGNITLDSPSIIAVPDENSDITANAYSGSGGQVQITASGVFGLQPRTRQELQTLLGTDDPTQLDPDHLRSNDITAISRLDPSLSGLVTFNTPDVDPSQGIVKLPAQLVDFSNQIAASCPSDGESVGSNQFVITGRGGLPPSPGDPLTSEAVLTDWVTLGGSREQGAGSREQGAGSRKPKEQRGIHHSPSPHLPISPSSTIVEAQGWVINSKGEVVLTASAPTPTLDIPWLHSANCHH